MVISFEPKLDAAKWKARQIIYLKIDSNKRAMISYEIYTFIILQRPILFMLPLFLDSKWKEPWMCLHAKDSIFEWIIYQALPNKNSCKWLSRIIWNWDTFYQFICMGLVIKMVILLQKSIISFHGYIRFITLQIYDIFRNWKDHTFWEWKITRIYMLCIHK